MAKKVRTTIYSLVAKELKKLGYKALEEMNWVRIYTRQNDIFNFGRVNGTWQGDLVDPFDFSPTKAIGFLDTKLQSDNLHENIIALAFHEAYQNGEFERYHGKAYKYNYQTDENS